MKFNWKNIVERAAWTFLQAFLVALPSAFSLDLDGAAWKSALFSAACAGLSALKTVIVDLISARLEKIKGKEAADDGKDD